MTTKEPSSLGFMDARTHLDAEALNKRIKTIATDKNTSIGQKLISLMKLAKSDICIPGAARTKKARQPAQIDLFAHDKQIAIEDPYTVCQSSFVDLMDKAKKKRGPEAFNPVDALEDSSLSPWIVAHDIRKGEIRSPRLNVFAILIEKRFPEQIAKAKATEEAIAIEKAERIERNNKLIKGEIKTEAWNIFITDKGRTPVQRYAELMLHAAKEFKKTPNVDLKDVRGNDELLVALALMSRDKNKNGMLYHMHENKVDPHKAIWSSEGPSLMMMAEEMIADKETTALGVYLKERLDEMAARILDQFHSPNVYRANTHKYTR